MCGSRSPMKKTLAPRCPALNDDGVSLMLNDLPSKVVLSFYEEDQHNHRSKKDRYPSNVHLRCQVRGRRRFAAILPYSKLVTVTHQTLLVSFLALLKTKSKIADLIAKCEQLAVHVQVGAKRNTSGPWQVKGNKRSRRDREIREALECARPRSAGSRVRSAKECGEPSALGQGVRGAECARPRSAGTRVRSAKKRREPSALGIEAQGAECARHRGAESRVRSASKRRERVGGV